MHEGYNIIMFSPLEHLGPAWFKSLLASNGLDKVKGWAIDVHKEKLRYCHDIFHQIGCISSDHKLPRKGSIIVQLTWTYGHVHMRIGGNNTAAVYHDYYGKPQCTSAIYFGGMPGVYSKVFDTPAMKNHDYYGRLGVMSFNGGKLLVDLTLKQSRSTKTISRTLMTQ